MLSGSISLKHPGLNLRPEFTSALKEKDDARVILFDTQDQVDLGQTLDRVAQINSNAARSLKEGDAAFAKAEANGELRFELIEEPRENASSQILDLKSLSETSLKTAANLASAAAFALGPVIMGSAENLSDGIQKLDFYKQTSQEGLINSASEFAYVTGDSYHNRVSRRDGNENPLFDTESAPTGSLMVDLQNGVAVLEDYR